MRKLRGINLAIVILSGILMLTIGFAYSQINDNKIARNTYIKDINVSNLSKEEAKEKLKSECRIDTITFTYKDKTWNVDPKDIDTNYDIDTTVENAYKINRDEKIFLNTINTIKSIFGKKTYVNIVVNCNDSKVKNELEKISKEIDIKMQNARLDFSYGNMNIIEEKEGIELDIDATINNLEKSLQNGSYKENLVVTKVAPDVTKVDLKDIDTLLGGYSTTLSDRSADRVENIKLAVERTSGILLMPGEEFSYNEHTGMRTIENGYKKATVIVSGEAVQGVGGGVCQVSTTLYNAVLYSGLDIVKVYNHSIPSSYVNKGRDATVSDSGLDFIFKNNYNQPVYIQNNYSNGVVTCQIYGYNNNKQNIEILTNTDKITSAPVKKEKDATMQKGKEKIIRAGRDAYTVSTYRVYYDNDGKEIKKEKVATSYYPPKEKIIAVGTKKEKVKKEEVKKEEVKKEPESSKEENNENKNNENKNDVNENVKDDVPKDDNSSDTIESEGDKEEPAQ